VATDIVMPRLSDSMEEGTILRWIKSEGDEVAVGDELVEIETDKANMVYEADTSGTLIEILAREGDTLPIGEAIARVGEAGEAPAGARKAESAAAEGGDGAGGAGAAVVEAGPDPAAASTVRDAEQAAAAPPAPPAPAATPAAPAEAAGDGRVKASPIARRIARERGLDLAGIPGSGPGGRIVKADVERAVAAGPAAPAPAATAAPTAPAGPTSGAREQPETAKGQVETVELTKLQQTVARRMAESKATAPHFYLETEVDMSRAVEARARIKAGAKEGDPVPSFNDMVVKAAALALAM